MPTIFGIPLIGFIQMILGAAIVLFVLIKFLGRPKNKKDSFIIKNVHIITGDGTEAVNRNVYVTKGIIEERPCIPKAPLRPTTFPITATPRALPKSSLLPMT